MSDTSKHWTEILITPIVVVLLGGFGTYQVTQIQLDAMAKNQQQEEASLAAMKELELRAQRTNVDLELASLSMQTQIERELKLLEIIERRITGDAKDQQFAVALIDLLENDLQLKLLKVVAVSETIDQNVRLIAAKTGETKVSDAIAAIQSTETRAVRNMHELDSSILDPQVYLQYSKLLSESASIPLPDEVLEDLENNSKQVQIEKLNKDYNFVTIVKDIESGSVLAE